MPPIGAAKLMDVAEAMAPGHSIDIIGLRPGGEKLHETLMTEAEAGRMSPRSTHRDVGIVDAIVPAFHPWRLKGWPGGSANSWWLMQRHSDTAFRYSMDELRKMLEAIP